MDRALDQAGTGDGPSFYVYNLQNQRAEKLGPLLTQAFTGRAPPAAAARAPPVARGRPPARSESAVVRAAARGRAADDQRHDDAAPGTQAAATAATARAGEGLGVVRNIQVVADKDQNTLLIIATAQEYRVIEAALKKLDVLSRQVLIDVTMAEVTLTDELQFGVEWMFRDAAPSGRGAGGLFTRSGPINPGAAAAAGGRPARRSHSRRASSTSSTMRRSRAASRPHCICSTPTATRRCSRTRTCPRSTTRRRRSRRATGPICQQSVVGSTTNVVTTTSQ